MRIPHAIMVGINKYNKNISRYKTIIIKIYNIKKSGDIFLKKRLFLYLNSYLLLSVVDGSLFIKKSCDEIYICNGDILLVLA